MTTSHRHSANQVQPDLLLGWREWVSLPELNIPAIKAKVDTGARTSAIHAFYVDRFRRKGQAYVRFGVHPLQHRRDIARECSARVIDERAVTDSGGHREDRLVVMTPLRLGSQEWNVEITLTNRDTMLFRMLIGREALRGHAWVNPGVSYQVGKPRLTQCYPELTRNTNRQN